MPGANALHLRHPNRRRRQGLAQTSAHYRHREYSRSLEDPNRSWTSRHEQLPHREKPQLKYPPEEQRPRVQARPRERDLPRRHRVQPQRPRSPPSGAIQAATAGIALQSGRNLVLRKHRRSAQEAAYRSRSPPPQHREHQVRVPRLERYSTRVPRERIQSLLPRPTHNRRSNHRYGRLQRGALPKLAHLRAPAHARHY